MHVNLQGEDRKKSGRKRGGSRGYPELLDAGELEEMFRYPERYHNGLPEEQVEKVTDSIRYFKNNQKGLLLYQKQRFWWRAGHRKKTARDMHIL